MIMDATTIQVGDKVRSYDFPGDRDDCYVEGEVIGYRWLNGCERYAVRVYKKVWQGKPELVAGIVFPPLNGTPTMQGDYTNGVEKIDKGE